MPSTATPTRESTTSGFDGFALPLVEHVTREIVRPDDYRRIDPPAPSGFYPRTGDLIRLDARRRGLAYVHESIGETIEVEWLSGFAHGERETLEGDEFLYQLEAGRAEKVSSGLSPRQARYLVGDEQVSGEGSVSATVSDLTFTREYSAAVVDRFINHPSVQHKLGANYCTDRAAFGARLGGEDGPLVAVVVFSIPTGRMLDQSRTVELKRYAAHPRSPSNTASWLISRALQWADLEGYTRVLSYAGISNNEGTVYRALGFEPVTDTDPEEPSEHSQATLSETASGTPVGPALTDGSGTVAPASTAYAGGWSASRDGRVEMDHYEKRRYEYTFESYPETVRRPESEPLGTSDDTQSCTLSAFGGGTPSPQGAYTPADDLVSTDMSDRTQAYPDFLFGRWDTRPRAVSEALQQYGDQTTGSLTTDTLFESVEKASGTYAEPMFEGAFVATTADGIAAVAIVDEPDDQGRWEFDTLEVVGYGAVETGYPSNVATTLLARIRDWAALEGYSTVAGTAATDTTLQTALKQAGFTSHDGGETWETTVSL